MKKLGVFVLTLFLLSCGKSWKEVEDYYAYYGVNTDEPVEIFDNNENLLGTIKQENIIKSAIINYVWEEISNKIIEMSLSELNMIINL